MTKMVEKELRKSKTGPGSLKKLLKIRAFMLFYLLFLPVTFLIFSNILPHTVSIIFFSSSDLLGLDFSHLFIWNFHFLLQFSFPLLHFVCLHCFIFYFFQFPSLFFTILFLMLFGVYFVVLQTLLIRIFSSFSYSSSFSLLILWVTFRLSALLLFLPVSFIIFYKILFQANSVIFGCSSFLFWIFFFFPFFSSEISIVFVNFHFFYYIWFVYIALSCISSNFLSHLLQYSLCYFGYILLLFGPIRLGFFSFF